MNTSHSVMEGQRHNNPLTRVVFIYNGHAIVEVAKALGGSFKLVMPEPKPVREMTQLLRETQKDGDTETKQKQSNTNKYTKYKPRLNTNKKLS